MPPSLSRCQRSRFVSGSVDVAGAGCYGRKAKRTGKAEWAYIVNKKLLLAVAACTLGLLFVLNATSKEPWSIVFGPADLGDFHFESVEPVSTPNSYLVCPRELCTSRPPDMAPEVYKASAAELMQLARETWSDEPGTRLVHDAPAAFTLRFVQRSKIMRFPDTISVRFIPVDEQQATIAIYSRSQIGYSDLGANEDRVKRWLGQLGKRVDKR